MATARRRKTTTISLPPQTFRQVGRMAKANGMTISELFREAFRRYQREEETWQALWAYGRRKAKATGIGSERDVERLIDAARRQAKVSCCHHA